jgi:hypothetical protein
MIEYCVTTNSNNDNNNNNHNCRSLALFPAFSESSWVDLDPERLLRIIGTNGATPQASQQQQQQDINLAKAPSDDDDGVCVPS